MLNSPSVYTVDNIKFESKIQACLFASQINKDVTWNFNKEFFSIYDWSKEPTKAVSLPFA